MRTLICLGKNMKYFFLTEIINMTYSFLFLFVKSRKKSAKYYFSICAIFKDEAPYMREWIEFHRLIGVDHFYLYNNFSTDNYKEVLNEYVIEGCVTLIDWPFEHGQISSYEDCLNQFSSENQWISFIDLDEFICPIVKEDIKDWIKKYEKYPSIVIYWLMFGTNGIMKADPSKLVIEQYTQTWKSVRNVGKIVLNTNFKPVKVYHHHIFCYMNFLWLRLRVPMINESKRFILYPGRERCPIKSTIQINHYWSKSLQEYVRKIEKGDVFSSKNGKIRMNLDFFYWHEYQNIVDNKIIWRFLMSLKIRLDNINVKFKC